MEFLITFSYTLALDFLELMWCRSAIQRVIFETLTKFDGHEQNYLEYPHVKQIGGRAGRYRTAPSLPLKSSGHDVDSSATIPPVGPLPAMPNPGIVTTFEEADMKYLKVAMQSTIPPIPTAGILPPDQRIEKFARTFPPRRPFSRVLQSLFDMARVNMNLFHLCAVDALMNAAGVVEQTKGLTVAERITITQAPLPKKDIPVKQALISYSQLIAESRAASILDVQVLDWQVLDNYLAQKADPAEKNSNTEILGDSSLMVLPQLESLHKSTMLWLWLS